MDATRAIALGTEYLYFVTQNNPLEVLSGIDAGEKNLSVFHFLGYSLICV